MTEAGYERTAQQCRNKIKKLTVYCRKIKDKRKTGEGRYPIILMLLMLFWAISLQLSPPVVVKSLGASAKDPPKQGPELDSPLLLIFF